MKKIAQFLLVTLVTGSFVACSNADYSVSKSGMRYKIFPSDEKDSLAQEGDWLKIHLEQRINDSFIHSTYGKMPVYSRANIVSKDVRYNPVEIFGKLKKGDSAVVVMILDSMLKKGLLDQMPPNLKPNDRIVYNFKVIEIFRNDSLYRADERRERDLDAPRQEKEMQEQMEKARKEMAERRQQEEEEYERTGEAEKGIKAMEEYLASKNITNAKKFGKGTYVVVKKEGNGEQAGAGKYVKIEYVGSLVRNDSIFDKGDLQRMLGRGELISGMEEGLEAFKQGGEGTLYIPGFRAYGRNHPRFQPFEPMKFDVKVLHVADTMMLTELGPAPRKQPARN